MFGEQIQRLIPHLLEWFVSRKQKKEGQKLLLLIDCAPLQQSLLIQWIPIQPGTDLALIYGILNQCFKKGEVERTFGLEFCQGFSELEEYVNQYNLEEVEHTTEYPKKQFKNWQSFLLQAKKSLSCFYRVGVFQLRLLLAGGNARRAID